MDFFSYNFFVDYTLVYLKGDNAISQNTRIKKQPELAKRLFFICCTLAMI